MNERSQIFLFVCAYDIRTVQVRVVCKLLFLTYDKCKYMITKTPKVNEHSFQDIFKNKPSAFVFAQMYHTCYATLA